MMVNQHQGTRFPHWHCPPSMALWHPCGRARVHDARRWQHRPPIRWPPRHLAPSEGTQVRLRLENDGGPLGWRAPGGSTLPVAALSTRLGPNKYPPLSLWQVDAGWWFCRFWARDENLCMKHIFTNKVSMELHWVSNVSLGFVVIGCCWKEGICSSPRYPPAKKNKTNRVACKSWTRVSGLTPENYHQNGQFPPWMKI